MKKCFTFENSKHARGVYRIAFYPQNFITQIKPLEKFCRYSSCFQGVLLC